MATQQQSIGMMEGAFFIPKTELLNWVNGMLKLNIQRIQQLGTGAVYCQVIDIMFPGKVAMQRIQWKARNQWEFINNYKILQQSFARCKIQKYIDIEKLSKCKYQDNLQFIQWLKRYFDLYNKSQIPSYDPELARKNADVDFSFIDVRNPLKRDRGESFKNLRKAKSPYDNVRPKINNRSVTVGKQKQTSEGKYFIDKLTKIKDVLSKGGKEQQKLEKIQEIIEEIEGEVTMNNESTVSVTEKKLQTVPSKEIINKKKVKKTKQIK